MSRDPDLKLGLIGDNISRSRSPLLHRQAGEQNGMTVQYDRLIPKDLNEDFDTVFDMCTARGYRGINVTYPYKERAATKVYIADPSVRIMGAVNTVLFEETGPVGLNTDYSGFISAYRGVRSDTAPGICCLIGTGGVGRAMAFALSTLGAEEIRLVDYNIAKAELLAHDLRSVGSGARIVVSGDAAAASAGAQGLLNATPVGMVGYGGTPLPKTSMEGAEWAFDAVYTPVDTPFLLDAAETGLTVISGYELFFYQGVHAWAHFSGTTVDEARLRLELSKHSVAA